MNFMYILSLILAPLIAFILFFYLRYKYGKEKYNFVFKSFLYGIISIILVVIFQYIANYFGLDIFKNFRRIIFYSFVVMGIGSELGKYLVLRYYNFPKKDFNGPLESIIYSIMIAMGFAFIGNVLYFTLPVYKEINFMYAITVIFANVFFAVILGFFVGLAKARENRFVDLMTGLFGASFFHALYNFCFITEDYRLLLFLTIGAFVIVILLFFKAVGINEEFKRLKIQ
ncbi:MAG: PrsW family intramembrane metalloprotease [Bacteroidales bacterium]|nr:PrsW family intramembrane metalloprotease [Bacteroidales bacterium]